MGSEENSDMFLMVIRPALYKDEQAGDDYRNNIPAVLLRITPNESTELDPYDYPELRVRGTGTTEFDLLDDLEELRVAILNKHSGLTARELPTSIFAQPGIDGIQRGIHWSSVKPKKRNELPADSGSLRQTVKNLYDELILLQV